MIEGNLPRDSAVHQGGQVTAFHEVMLRGRETMEAFAEFKGIAVNGLLPGHRCVIDLDTGEVFHSDPS